MVWYLGIDCVRIGAKELEIGSEGKKRKPRFPLPT
jgi:hypothetical protein